MDLAKYIVNLNKNNLVKRELQSIHYAKYQNVMMDILLDLIRLVNGDDIVVGYAFYVRNIAICILHISLTCVLITK